MNKVVLCFKIIILGKQSHKKESITNYKAISVPCCGWIRTSYCITVPYHIHFLLCVLDTGVWTHDLTLAHSCFKLGSSVFAFSYFPGIFAWSWLQTLILLPMASCIAEIRVICHHAQLIGWTLVSNFLPWLALNCNPPK